MFVGMHEQLVAEREQLLLGRELLADRLPLAFFERSAQPFDSARKKIFLALEVCVERRSTHVRAIDDVLHRQRLESFLLNERHQRRSKELLRTLNAPIDCFLGHVPSLAFRTIQRRVFDN